MEHENIKFFNNDKGFQKLVNSFKSKGQLKIIQKSIYKN